MAKKIFNRILVKSQRGTMYKNHQSKRKTSTNRGHSQGTENQDRLKCNEQQDQQLRWLENLRRMEIKLMDHSVRDHHIPCIDTQPKEVKEANKSNQNSKCGKGN